MSVVDVQDAIGRKLPFELIPTSLPGAFISPPPPADFDPMNASEAMLARAGIFWRRPGPGDHPRLVEAWERVARRGWRPEDRIVPEFDVQVGVSHQLRGAKQVADTQFTSSNWSGATLKPPTGHSWSGAIGHWTIPTVSEPTEPQGTEGGWNSSSWVGIDGGYGSNDVLQAGIQQRVDAHGNTSYVAWYEWFAPQQPGSPGYIWQTNIPNFSITLAPPPGASFDGDTAEWIMETPDFGEGPASLPSFTPVHFQGAVCCGQNVPSGDPLNGDTWVIDGFGRQLTSVALATGSVTITFTG